MSRNVYTYIGAGQVYLRRLDIAHGLLPIGDVSELELSIETDEITLTQHTQPGGGNLDKVERISSMGVSLTLAELKPENVAMALYGDATVVAAAEVVDESHTVAATGA
ncbi:hypothetical protein Q4595_17865, partial [Wenyingzhuangia sp. 1_MG-2023]|nr:hypothetical protein [Wenyingzhuangia sp. 1_MG-2023]